MVVLISRDPERDNIDFGNGPCLPNYVSSWYGPDSKEAFDRHLRDVEKRLILEKAGWIGTNIAYRSNDRGFRMDANMRDLRPGNGILYLGCSITFGVGMSIESNWSYRHHQRQGGDYINLAYPGTGIETQYRMLLAWAGTLRPRRAYTIGAFFGRREVISHDGIRYLGPWVDGEDARLYQELAGDDRESRISFLRSIDGMRAVCHDHGIELYSLKDGVFSGIGRSLSDPGEHPARDLMHRGTVFHERLADLSDDHWIRLA